MKIKFLFSGLVLSGFLMFCPATLQAQQQEPDEITLTDVAFEEHFFEALKQKGIENYDKALQALQQCMELKPESPFLYNEVGKNQLALKHYTDAEAAFKKATELDPENRWYWQGLYDVYYAAQDWNRAIPIVQKLTKWRKEFYEEDLVSLYMYTSQFEKALALIDSLDESVGQSNKREMYRLQIMRQERFKKPKKEMLEEAIKKNPQEESNYLELIFLYSESNQEAKAEEVAKRLEKAIPDSDWAQVSLFKFHLNNEEGDKASESLFRVLQSEKIDVKIKHRAFNEFLIYVKNNPQYNNNLEEAISYFDDAQGINVPKEVGKFFYSKKDYQRAATYFEKSLEAEADDIETVELLLYSFEASEQYKLLLEKAESYLELYPIHSRLYYFAGFASNKLNQFKEAKIFLEDGLDFLVEDSELEAGFYNQLAIASEGLGDSKRGNLLKERAAKLLKQKKT